MNIDQTDHVPSSETDAPAGPLHGVRVIDLSSVVMGPYACQILGDMGADVIKVEPPDGDPTRRTVPQRNPGMGALGLHVNRNKRSVVLDLKTAQGHHDLVALLRTADVLVTNMRPRALARLGLDPDAIAGINPRLVYCTAQGFRSDSALADRAAYDEIVQSASGLVDLMRRATGTPTYVPTIISDKVCAMTIAYSVLAALVHQRATGQGQHVEVPMTDTLLAFTMVEHLSGDTFSPQHAPAGYARSLANHHAAVRTADGWACLLPYNDRDIVTFFTAAGRPDLAADERFLSPAQRALHWGELYAAIGAVAPTRTTAEWETLCAAHSVPMSPVLDVEKAVDDPYVQEGHLLDVHTHPTEGEYRVIGSPVRFSATPTALRRHAPTLGQDTDEVLAELR